MKKGTDPITFELIKNSLSSIIDEMALTMNRTAYSPLLRDLFDFATGLCDAEGNILAEGLVNPVHAGVFPKFIEALMNRWKGNIHSGDIFMANDPYEGASHIPDLYLVRPVFIGKELVAFAGAIAHQLDFGGRVPGSNACDNTEIYQEGLRIPPLKYYEKGQRNDTLHRLIEKNVRISNMVLGDLSAQVAATGIGERKFVALVEKYGGWKTVKRYLGELMDYTERLTRAAIRKLPDGSYEFEDFLDDDGFSTDPVKFHIRITIKGDEITFDFTGTSPTVKGSINMPLPSTIAIVGAAMRLFLDASVPSNSGMWRAIRLIAPYDTIVNAGFPRGVAGRGATFGRVFDVITGAMAQIIPDKVFASSAHVDFGLCMGGTNLEGNPFVYTDFIVGNWGGRPFADGHDGHSPYWLNYSNIPVECIEKEYPLRIERYAYIPDSGGAGKFRGGIGLTREYRILVDDVVVQWRQDRAKFAPWGLAGGKSGATAKGFHISDGRKRPLKKEIFIANRGDVLSPFLPGGGGFGNPLERSVERVLDDVVNEKVSLKAAEKEYGVVIDPATLKVDSKETEELRQKMKRNSV
jgi:N-methylhydantoinase B